MTKEFIDQHMQYIAVLERELEESRQAVKGLKKENRLLYQGFKKLLNEKDSQFNQLFEEAMYWETQIGKPYTGMDLIGIVTEKGYPPSWGKAMPSSRNS